MSTPEVQQNTGKADEKVTERKPWHFQPGHDPRRNTTGMNKGSMSFATALRKEAERQAEYVDDGEGNLVKLTALEFITRKLVELAKAGDMSAIKEIADRLDGKSKQNIDLEGNIDLNVALLSPEDKVKMMMAISEIYKHNEPDSN